jgi:hypothetical protein
VNLSGRLTNIQVAFAFALAQSDANVNVGVTAWIGENPSKGVRAVVTAFWKPRRPCPLSCLSRLLRLLLLVPFLFSVVPFLLNRLACSPFLGLGREREDRLGQPDYGSNTS